MATNPKYGDVTTSKKSIGKDEPVFLLRGTDPLAVTAVAIYAALCRSHSCDPSFVRSVLDRAEAIEHWQEANPQLVKERPD